jgi:hypothetical protein
MNRPLDHDAIRELFQQVQPPPGVERWRLDDGTEGRVDERAVSAVPILPLEYGRSAGERAHRPRPRSLYRTSLAVAACAMTVVGASAAFPLASYLVAQVPATRTASQPGSSPPASPSEAPAARTAAPAATNGSASARAGAATPANRWPASGNTGVPAGIALRTHRGDLDINVAGTVIDGMLVTGSIIVQAPNVTIRNTRIAPSATTYWAVRQLAPNLTIEDSEIAGGGVAQSGVSQESTGLVVARCAVHDVFSGAVLGTRASVKDSSFHDLSIGVSSQGNVSDITVRHDSITANAGGDAAVGLYANAGPLVGVTIQDNLLAGGGYTVYGGAGTGSHDIRMIGNRFSRSLFPRSGSYGPVTGWDAHASGNTWTDNVWDDTGTPVGP